MTYPSSSIAKTRIFARLEQALNTASAVELQGYLEFLTQGGTFTALLELQWKAGNPMSLSRQDQRHVLDHAFPAKGEGWWGSNANAIATEASAQMLHRMLHSADGTPRKWPRRVECLWVLAVSHNFHVSLTDSAQQVTALWMTPPKGDQKAEYALYQQVQKLAAAQLSRPRDRASVVPSNLTRLENIWTISDKRWALLEGVDDNGKPRAVAAVQKSLTKSPGVVVARSYCEDYKDRGAAGGKGTRKVR